MCVVARSAVVAAAPSKPKPNNKIHQQRSSTMALTADQYQTEAENALQNAKNKSANTTTQEQMKAWAMVADVYAKLYIDAKSTTATPTV
jgi:hemoglobin-like flavoprotein